MTGSFAGDIIVFVCSEGNGLHTHFAGKAALVGMMASGKTTVGRLLARRLGAAFVDVDDEVAAAAGMSIAAYFAARGEEAFRALERETIGRLLREEAPAVLSLGGGAFMQEPIRDMLRGRARSVFLRVDAGEIVRRLEGTDIAKRPLLAASPDWREKVAALLAEREAVYAEADVCFDANARDPEALARDLAGALEAGKKS